MRLINQIVTETWKTDKPELKSFSFNDLLYVVQEMMQEEGKPYLEKKTTLRGYYIFRQFVELMLYRNLANYDSMILITSEKGTGKSSAAIMLAREWCRLIGIKFNPKRHIAYNNADVMRKIDVLNNFEPLICVSGDTMIHIRTKHGVFTDKIENLVGRTDFEVLSYNIEKDKFEWKKPKAVICTKEDIVNKVVLENDSFVEATDNHLFLTKYRGYQRVDKLEIGDEIISVDKNSKVKNIEKGTKKIKVYDIIGIPDNHNFLGNGMILHNCDEAIRFASSEDWNKKENKELKKKLAQVRTKHLFFILCFPLKIMKLEKTYLESFVNYWIDLFARGKGAIYVKDRNPVMDSWRVKDFKNIGSYTEFTSLSKVQQALKKHPNFWHIIKLPKPPDWLYEKYLVVREKNVYDEDAVMQSVTAEDIQRALMVLSLRDIMMADQTVNMNRIILHIKTQYDINITKHQVQLQVEDAKQLISKVRQQAMTTT